MHLQAKLLRVLESNENQKIGMGESEYSDFRLIAATNRSLPELVRRRQFREDLYHRLNILELRLPPLREHRGDIPALIMQLIEGIICGPQKALEVHLSPEVLELFMLYRWPGNIRELKNVLAYAYCCMDEDELELTPRHLPERLLSRQRGETPSVEVQGNFSLQAMQEETEKRAIESVLTVTGGNKTRAAKLLGFSRNTLYLKMKALGIPSRKA